MKSLVERRAIEGRERYWDYGNRVAEDTINRTQGKKIELRQFPDRSCYDRWRALKIGMPIWCH
ncbi:hypothetical protein [Bradyrhizobium sp. CCGUVB23]|uniref:hypothetical protein n=1 Tax=Bradyrhizobium sp. CCGUVB23 TaxID=2949630 RepID=UPI0020B3A966|nr:hypothetical protein [Bradyrhizobium sp. CCGUVB23]MCP3467993.1 hypothetical protein [Bradyrhizobium sp. CCGUVB23]